MSKVRIGMAIVLVCALAFPATSVLAQDTAAREATDRAEIEELMGKYTRALDHNNGPAYAAAYTVDGEFRAGATSTKGREALKKMVDDLKVQNDAARARGETRAPLYHMETNTWVEFVDKDHARYHSYYLTVSGAAGQANPPRIAAAGRSVNHLERVTCKWLLTLRDVAPPQD